MSSQNNYLILTVQKCQNSTEYNPTIPKNKSSNMQIYTGENISIQPNICKPVGEINKKLQIAYFEVEMK